MAVEDSWQRLVSWCEQNAPVTFGRLRPAAPAGELQAAQRLFPREWPEDLRRWYALHDGAQWESANTPLPDWRILSLKEMAENAEMYAGFYDNEELVEGEQDDAGSMSVPYLPSFVPIADNITACALFVDIRPGPRYGCVSDFDRDEGATHEPTWNSVTAMLDDVASALEAGSRCDGWYPTVVEGELTWELDDPNT